VSVARVFAKMIPATNTAVPQAIDKFPSTFCGLTTSSCQNLATKLRGFGTSRPPARDLFRNPGWLYMSRAVSMLIPLIGIRRFAVLTSLPWLGADDGSLDDESVINLPDKKLTISAPRYRK
jgi:hypothetical protein